MSIDRPYHHPPRLEEGATLSLTPGVAYRAARIAQDPAPVLVLQPAGPAPEAGR